MTAEERLACLRSLVGISVEAVRQAAIVLSVMEERGDDIGQVPTNLRNMLRRIRADQLLPEVVTNFTGRLRQRLQNLPIAEQRRIVGGGKIAILPAPDAAAVELDPQHLDPQQVMQVFGDGYIRSTTEQRVWLLSRALAVAEAAEPERRLGRPALDAEVDVKRGGVVIHGKFVSRRQLVQLLAQLPAKSDQ